LIYEFKLYKFTLYTLHFTLYKFTLHTLKDMDYRKNNAPQTTITRDMNALSSEVGNVYETVKIIAKRSNQISSEMKTELEKKLADFASYNDNIEEVFENREQIEISRFYEKLPKATLLASQEFVEGKIHYRNPLKEKTTV